MTKTKEAILDKIHTMVAEILEDGPDDKDAYMTRIQEVFESVGFQLGYMDGLACLAGADSKDRRASMQLSIKDGKHQVLKEHEKVGCSGCEGTKILWSELNPN